MTDPSVYLESCGYTVRREGRHLSARAHGDEVYRVTRKDEGHFVACDKYGNGIGDNIALVQDVEPGTGFSDAVYKLGGAPRVGPSMRPTEPTREPPTLPPASDRDRLAGRSYLDGRGIDAATLDTAEKAGMLRYTGGAVLFVGQDRAGMPRNVTRRATESADPIQKRDLRGSDKRFPPILKGDPASVWIVEGGADALAAHSLAQRQGKAAPTVIVSGGAKVRGFLENPDVQALLRKAERVTIAGENEKDAPTQAQTDAERVKLAARVREVTGRDVQTWTPARDQGKDLADLAKATQPTKSRGRSR